MSKKIKDLSIYGGTSLGWLEDAEEVEREDLLLKDLCGRLPYGVKVYAENVDLNGTIGGLSLNSVFLLELHDWWDIEFIKPHLRSMSSMTKEEKKIMRSCGFELIHYDTGSYGFANIENCIDEVSFKFMEELLNAHYFDYRGLIPKGLALEAPADMYNIKEK